jgi:hypothetical protein
MGQSSTKGLHWAESLLSVYAGFRIGVPFICGLSFLEGGLDRVKQRLTLRDYGRVQLSLNALRIGELLIQVIQIYRLLSVGIFGWKGIVRSSKMGKPSVQKVIILSLSALKEYRLYPRKKKVQSISKNPEARCLAGWFDGAACATGLNSGAGGVIRINENIIYKWYLNCGPGTNTRAELLGAWALLVLAIRFDILEFFVQGDSRIIIDWLIGKGQLHVIALECWKDRISELKSIFRLLLSSMFIVKKTEADNLSKIALHRLPGKIEFFQCVGDHEGPHMFLDIF